MVKSTHSMQASIYKTDRKQERPEIAGWICGFVDGEGCFSVSLIRNETTSHGWQVFPEFVVTQGVKSRSSIEEIQNFFECGRIYENSRRDNHSENLLRYCVRSRKELLERIIPFFEQYPLRTAKRNDFKKFKRIILLMEKGVHSTRSGLRQSARIIEQMNRKVPSRFLESPETKRQRSAKAE